jgi:hypothetical protein
LLPQCLPFRLPSSFQKFLQLLILLAVPLNTNLGNRVGMSMHGLERLAWLLRFQEVAAAGGVGHRSTATDIPAAYALSPAVRGAGVRDPYWVGALQRFARDMCKNGCAPMRGIAHIAQCVMGVTAPQEGAS